MDEDDPTVPAADELRALIKSAIDGDERWRMGEPDSRTLAESVNRAILQRAWDYREGGWLIVGTATGPQVHRVAACSHEGDDDGYTIFGVSTLWDPEAST